MKQRQYNFFVFLVLRSFFGPLVFLVSGPLDLVHWTSSIVKPCLEQFINLVTQLREGGKKLFALQLDKSS